MTLTPVAFVLLTVQRHYLEAQPDEHGVSLAWHEQVMQARGRSELIVLLQWDGPEGTPCETFGRGWVIHPDFVAQAGDLQIRAGEPDAFHGSPLHAELSTRGVRHLKLLAVPEAAVLEPTLISAQALGYQVDVVSPAPAQEVARLC